MTPARFENRVRPAVREHAERVVDLRRRFHRFPELSWQEEQTRDTILAHLHAIDGLEDVRPLAGTGATALVRGAESGPCVLWRADIDALPVPEATGLPFESANAGVMHACGHDAHIAIGLGLAETLAGMRDRLAGTVRLVFQPAEEAEGGARTCIKEGVLEEPHVDRILGLHVSADVPLGAINVAPGPFFASPTGFAIEITGVGGHAAAPHQGVDAVVVAAHCIVAMQTIVSRSTNPLDAAVLTIGTVNAGYRQNVIAASARLTGTIRTYDVAVLDIILRRIDAVVAGVCAAFGARHALSHHTGCPPLVNDEATTSLVLDQAADFFGPGNIYATPSMGAEDMGEFLIARPGCFFWIGARNEAAGIAGRHHDSGFVIDEGVLTLGVEFGVRVIEAAMREPPPARG